jgi:IAA-amino acid hydrolase
VLLLLPLQVLETEPIMPGEDFSFFTRTVPSTFMFLGIRNEAVGSVHNLHNANFKIDEGVLPLGAAMHASLAMEYLSRGQEGFGSKSSSSSGSNKEEL